MLNLEYLNSKYNCTFKGVIHIGANEAEEYFDYKKLNISPIVFFEPIDYNIQQIINKTGDDSDVKIFPYGLGSKEEIKTFYIANNRASSSCLKPKEHLEQYPGITFSESKVEIKTLDSFNFTDAYNFLNIDVQGFELEVLKGGLNTLKHIHYIILEVNNVEMYEGCSLFEEIKTFLNQEGFQFKEADFQMGENNWGDAFFIK